MTTLLSCSALWQSSEIVWTWKRMLHRSAVCSLEALWRCRGQMLGLMVKKLQMNSFTALVVLDVCTHRGSLHCYQQWGAKPAAGAWEVCTNSRRCKICVIHVLKLNCIASNSSSSSSCSKLELTVVWFSVLKCLSPGNPEPVVFWFWNI